MSMEKTENQEKGVVKQEEHNAQKNVIHESKNNNVVTKTLDNKGKTLWQYFVECLTTKFCCAKGRARRKEYFGFILFQTLFSYLINFLGIATGEIELFSVFSFIYSLIIIFPSFGVTIRRLHDINMSGWWLLTVVIPMVTVFFKSDMKENKYGSIPEGVR